MRKENDTTGASEKMKALYKERPLYKWPSVSVSGKYRCRVRRHVRETDLAKNFEKYIPEKDKSKFYGKIGITPSDVPKILRGHIPTFGALSRYAARLGTTPDELVGELREYDTTTIKELWIFTDDTCRSVEEEIEVLELVEEYKPIDFLAAENEVVTDLIIGIVEQARKDIEDAERGKHEAEAIGANSFLRELHSLLTGEYGQKHAERFNDIP